MKVKKVLLILCALVLIALSAVSCHNDEEVASFYRSVSSRPTLTSATKISLGGYSFDRFLNRGQIAVRGTDEAGGNLYGVLSDRGEVVLPVRYTALSCEGDFLVAEGGDEVSRHYVFDKNGRQICVFDEEITVQDVGDGYCSVATKNASYLYSGNGENVLPGTLLDQTYSYSVCGDYALCRSTASKQTFVFHLKSSDRLLSFFDTSTRSYVLAFLGGRNFVAVCTDKVDSPNGADIELTRENGTAYYKQSVNLYTLGSSSPTRLTMGRFIVRVNNKYALGVTEEDRESYSLIDGYNAVSYYVTEGRKASGALGYYIADRTLAVVKDLPGGVSALLSPVDGVAASVTNDGAIVLVNEKAEVLRMIDDAVYQDVSVSGGVVTASKIVETGVIRRGGFDLEGKVTIPFEYSYLSAFVGGKAIATKGGKSYVLTTSGEEMYIGDFTFPHYFEGFYQTSQGDLIGLTSLDGATLVPPRYSEFTAVLRYENVVYVALTVGSATDVYRLY